MDDVIIFGRGWYYKEKKTGILEKYHIIAFLDNSVKTENKDEEEGIPVFHPHRISEIAEVPVLLMSVKFIDMWIQLIRMGVDPDRIRFGMQVRPYFEESEKMFGEWNAQIQAGLDAISIECKGERYYFSEAEQYRNIIRHFYKMKDPLIRTIAQMPVIPSSRRFGVERGKPVDRYYIEKFLKENQSDIHGDVMEVGENTYTKMFGSKIQCEYILHVNGWGENAIKGNLQTGEGIIENSVDCFICTQTLQSIYGIKKVVENIYKLLKPGGTALITVNGLGELSLFDYRNWGEYWRFTDQSLRMILEESFSKNNVSVTSFGNVKIAISFLYGICTEELNDSDFDYNDAQYQVIVAAKVKKEF